MTTQDTEVEARTEFENHADAVDTIHAGDVEVGDTVEVDYVDTYSDDQTEVGTVTDAEVVEAGTVHGEDPYTWETETTHYTVEYEVDGKNDHTVAGEMGGDAPVVYTAVGGRDSDGGNRREMGHATRVVIVTESDDTDTDVVTDGGTDVATDTRSACVWCGDEHDADDLRSAHDGDRCPDCYYDPDAEHADTDFDVEDLRHVVTDRDGTHIVAVPDDDVALCGSLAGGLTTFGDAADTPEDAARLGAWVNVREDICDACADVVNDRLFER